MNRKIILFITLSILILLVGVPLLLKQNWKQFSEKRDAQPQMLSDTLNNVKLSDGQEDAILSGLLRSSQ